MRQSPPDRQHRRATSRLGRGAAWAAMLLGVVAAPQLALACGGCFSPVLPPAPGQPGNGQAVLQDAERVVFHHDPKTGRTRVWVEVRYTGAAEDFGWVLPLPKQPTVTVGTTIGLDLIDQGTAARYQLSYQGTENCRDPWGGCQPQQSDWGDVSYEDASAGADSGATGGGGDQPKVNILDQGQAGPYDYAVIQGSDAKQLQAWLDTRGYKIPTSATSIIQSHADKGDVFVAIKLQSGKGVNLIRPIVLEMQDADPCVPLRLTSIAASAELSVVVTLAGPGRAVPMNHMAVTVNPARINWFGGANNYQQLVAAAIDEAGGRGFVTESAQPGAQIQGLWSKDQLSTDSIAKATNLYELGKALFQSGQVWLHADAAQVFADKASIVEPIFLKFGVKDPVAVLGQLWVCGAVWTQPWRTPFGDGGCRAQGNPFGSDALYDTDAKAIPVDGAATAKLLDADIVKPLGTLFDGMRAAPTVTRMVMRIGPTEMDRDPIFGFHPSLPAVERTRTAKTWNVCTTGWLPADKRRLEIAGVGSWIVPFDTNAIVKDARFLDAPAASVVEAMDESGAPMVIAKSQFGLVDTAIAGALPGKPSPARALSLAKAQPWAPPTSDPPATKLTVWNKPGNCTPKAGWVDGKLPPANAVIPDPNNPDGDGPATGFDVSGTDAATDASGGAPSRSGGSGGGCTAAPTAPTGSAMLAGLFALLALLIATRRAAGPTPARDAGTDRA